MKENEFDEQETTMNDDRGTAKTANDITPKKRSSDMADLDLPNTKKRKLVEDKFEQQRRLREAQKNALSRLLAKKKKKSQDEDEDEEEANENVEDGDRDVEGNNNNNNNNNSSSSGGKGLGSQEKENVGENSQLDRTGEQSSGSQVPNTQSTTPNKHRFKKQNLQKDEELELIDED